MACKSWSPAAWPSVIVDQLEPVQVQHQQCGVRLVALRMRERLRHPVVEQQPVRQAGQGIVISELQQLVFGFLDGRDVGEDRDVVGYIAAFVPDGSNGFPCGEAFARFTEVPDFTLPHTVFFEQTPQAPVELIVLPFGFQHARILSDHFLRRVARYPGKRVVDGGNRAGGIGDDDRIVRVLEYCCGLPQLFLRFRHLRHVEQGGAALEELPFLIVNAGRVEQDGKYQAILAYELEFEVSHQSGLHESGIIVEESFPAIGCQQFGDVHPVDQLGRVVTQPLQFGFVHLHDQAVAVQRMVSAGGIVVQVAHLLRVSFQFPLGPFAFADVADDRHPPSVRQYLGTDFDRNIAAILVLEFPFRQLDMFGVPQEVFPGLRKAASVALRYQVDDGFSDQIVAAVSQHDASATVGIHISSIDIRNENAVGSVVEQLAEALLAFLEGLLRLLARGDVLHHADHENRLAVGIALIHFAAGGNPSHRTIRAGQPVFDLEGLALFDCKLQGFPDRCAIFRMNPVEKGV